MNITHDEEWRSDDNSRRGQSAGGDDTEKDVAVPAHTPSPAPVMAPKPERLNYKEKFFIKAHVRGVSAVKFSPDGSMICSGGMLVDYAFFFSLICFLP